MSKTTGAAERKTLSTRTGASAKLLQRKALEKAETGASPEGGALEDSFPAAGAGDDGEASVVELAAHADIKEPTSGSEPAPAAPIAAEAAPIVVASPTWSAQDEAAFQALSARRKASGYRGRGREVNAQLVRVGDIAPNPGTVVAAIVALVAERGTVARGELIGLMGATTFSNAKARPSDKSWCQGYVAGAIRSGFLAEASEPVVADVAA
ncbi:hypothetical protein [Sphingomonas colocasiae]|uniref:Uncharacterized protein n=1 Tax=Sphingomonas colocasiae TaxID=1848973 RepID=A0ABS7PR90_9SPHN|nr:hypothetical protein [Sphingomonas colocasiae]MBY8823856.1 hypothetical protein [Sphingomonas colocasiae]